jgi:hypothetical protein
VQRVGKIYHWRSRPDRHRWAGRQGVGTGSPEVRNPKGRDKTDERSFSAPAIKGQFRRASHLAADGTDDGRLTVYRHQHHQAAGRSGTGRSSSPGFSAARAVCAPKKFRPPPPGQASLRCLTTAARCQPRAAGVFRGQTRLEPEKLTEFLQDTMPASASWMRQVGRLLDALERRSWRIAPSSSSSATTVGTTANTGCGEAEPVRGQGCR